MTRPLDVHLDDDTLRLLAIEPAAGDAAATGHLATCAACQTRAVAAQRELEALRAEATAATDAAFSPADLVRQQRAVAARLRRGHRVARVLRFPIHGNPASPPADRRWLAAAAAAGLVVGLLAGQLPHLGESPQIVGPPSARAAAPASRPDGLLEDNLLSEVEAALDPDPTPELRALDALTPVHYEIR